MIQFDSVVSGLVTVGVMMASGLVLGTISDRLLRLVGVRDRDRGH